MRVSVCPKMQRKCRQDLIVRLRCDYYLHISLILKNIAYFEYSHVLVEVIKKKKRFHVSISFRILA